MTPSQRAAVVAEAQTWLRTPYHPMGRVKGVGVDCAMLPAEVYAACGVIPPQDIEDYPPDWHLHQGGERYLQRVLLYAEPTSAPGLPGDFALWRCGRQWSHGAILIGGGRVIHAVHKLGVVVDRLVAPELVRLGHPKDAALFTLRGR